MASTGNLIVQTPGGIELKGRRRLTDENFEAVLGEIQQHMDKAAEQEKPLMISDLDVSQNKLSYEQFDALFCQLGAGNVRVMRFRMFGCATLNDDVMARLGDYLRALGPENAPAEMHLSDCAITAEGWNAFMSAIEETDLYPMAPQRGYGQPAPLYLRMENNYIIEDYIREKVEAGIVHPFCKTPGNRPSSEGTIKVNLVVRQANGNFQQKQGEPPAPEEAAPPKQVFDKFEQQQQEKGGEKGGWGGAPSWGKGQAKGGAAPAWNGAASWAAPAWNGAAAAAGGKGAWTPGGKGGTIRAGAAALPAAAAGKGGKSVPRVIPAAGGAAAAAAWKPAQAGAQAGKGTFNAFGGGKIGGAAANGGAAKFQAAAGAGNAWARGGAAERSRTPAARQPAAPPPKSDMPYPWEEHFSEEYKIPYFWNAETGDSAWEKPTA